MGLPAELELLLKSLQPRVLSLSWHACEGPALLTIPEYVLKTELEQGRSWGKESQDLWGCRNALKHQDSAGHHAFNPSAGEAEGVCISVSSRLYRVTPSLKKNNK